MNVRNLRTLFGISVVVPALSACGGGGGGTTSGSAGQPTVSNESLGGIWVGTTSQSGSFQEFIGITLDDGRFRFVSLDTGGQFVGTANVSNGNSVSGAGFGVAEIGSTWINGATVTNVSLNGTIAERQSFDGTWSADTGESGTFNFDYDPIYERDSSLAKVSGTYTYFDAFGNPEGSYTVNTAGDITGSNVFGCAFGGDVSVINPAFNAYSVRLTVNNCGPDDGIYSGLGVLSDFNSTDDAFIVSLDDGSYFTTLFVLR